MTGNEVANSHSIGLEEELLSILNGQSVSGALTRTRAVNAAGPQRYAKQANEPNRKARRWRQETRPHSYTSLTPIFSRC